MGENIWGRPKSPVNRREYGPGQHGQRRKSKVSDFGLQLRAKQKLKGYYGDVTEKQFRRTYTEASKMKGDAGQNLIGSFNQPEFVLIDPLVLNTLPDRELRAGYAEVVKYGLLGDAGFFEWLEGNGPALAAGDADLRAEAVRRSVQMKADIVARDETEQGDRALLNLGHTFCHALEAATGYSDRLLHGEGVAIGCALAFELSSRLGLCSQEAPSRVRAHLKAMGMKTDIADIEGDLPDAAGLLDLMGQDKKVVDGQLRFILARSIGDAFVTGDVPRDTVLGVLKDALATR